MTKTYSIKTEADSLKRVSIFQLNKEKQLCKFPFRLEIIDDTGETEDSFRLISTQCYFGGQRYWIKCHCERRVGMIYEVGGFFACRYCHDLTYHSRNLKKSLRNNSLFNLFGDWIKIWGLQNSLKRWNYAGRPTKKFKTVFSFYSQLASFMI